MNQSHEIVKLVSTVLVSEGDFPLALPEPNGLNNGGYVLPFGKATGQAYSPIDVLVAGLEATRLDIIITNLAQFFDTHRLLWSTSQVSVALKINDTVRMETLASWRLVQLTQHSKRIKEVLKRNAPLTFKWGLM